MAVLGHARGDPCLVRVLLVFVLASAAVVTAEDGDGEKSRDKVREEFERSGFHWMTPWQYENIDKETNTKPYLFQFVWSGCWVCRGVLEHLATKESPMWISNLSAQFNAVLIADSWGSELVSPTYSELGKKYVPRSIFAWPNGTVRADLVGRNGAGDSQYNYPARDLLYKMWQLLQEQHNLTETYPGDLEDDLPS